MDCSRKSNVTLKSERLEQTLTNTKNYDIQGTKKGTYLDAKAKELKEKAQEIQSAASGASSVGDAAPQLATKAQDLNTAAGNISGGGLDELSGQATELANAAGSTGGSDQTSLYHTANELSSHQTNVARAIAVIDAFKKVKAAHEELSSKEKYQQLLKQAAQQSLPNTPEGKVKAVDEAWNQVKAQFEALCKALIKQFASQLATAAGLLADSGNPSDNADNVINTFDVVVRAYNQLSNPDNMDKAGEIQTQATTISSSAGGTLSSSSNKLNSAADTLKTNSNLANAKAFKDKYDAFKDVKSTIEIKDSGGNNNKNIIVINLPHINDTFKPRKYKFFWIIIPSIISQWLNFLIYVILLIVYMGGVAIVDSLIEYSLKGYYLDQGYQQDWDNNGNLKVKGSRAIDDDKLKPAREWKNKFAIGGTPGPSGCPKPADDSATETQINSIKLELTRINSKVTHKITLNGDDSNTVSTSKGITLGSSNGTLTINIPGGEIKLTDLTISRNILTIQSGSKVSVIKVGTKIKLQASPNISSNTLTLNKDDSAGGQEEAQISGGPVELNYSNCSGAITISGNAISDLRKYQPSLSPQYFDGGSFAFKKWSTYDAGRFYLSLSILIVIKISF